VGILLVHGFTGSPHSMRPVAQHFMELGYAVEMPVLTGHATRWQDLRDSTYQQWLASAEQGYRRLTDQGLRVVVIGMSMGGTVATHLSARLPVAVVVAQAVKVVADVKAAGKVMQAAQERRKTQCKDGKRKSKPKNLHTAKCSAKRSRTKNGI